jgi:CRISPR-associated protein Cmr3
VGLDFSRLDASGPLQMAIKVNGNSFFSSSLATLSSLHPLGGERRLVHWGLGSGGAKGWTMPDSILSQIMKGNGKVRMVLATPALFSGGWKPGWLNEGPHGLEGTPPGGDLKLRLLGVCLDRWQPLSGWSLEKGKVGQKPLRRLVPSGSVYFFEMVGGPPKEWGSLWLRPVSDDLQDRRDGFGLSLWGVWSDHTSMKKGV